MSIIDEVEALRRIPYFATMDSAKLKLLAFASHRLQLPVGGVLCREGEPGDAAYIAKVLPGASHDSPYVRYWAQIALGSLHDERGVTAQLKGLSDPVKMVREAARWGMRQTLLDDKGWDYLYALYATGDDRARELTDASQDAGGFRPPAGRKVAGRSGVAGRTH